MRRLLLVALVGCGSVQDDTPPDSAEPPPRVTVSELRALPDGPVSVTLEPTRMTYLRGNNIYLQGAAVGPAIFLFTPQGQTRPDIAIGNTVELIVTELATFEGNKEITRATVVSNDRAASDVSSLAQVLTTAPNEDLEAELVRFTGATVLQAAPPDFQIRLTSNAMLGLFSPFGEAAGLCVGATFDAQGVIVEFRGMHEVGVGAVDDFKNVVKAGCSP